MIKDIDLLVAWKRKEIKYLSLVSIMELVESSKQFFLVKTQVNNIEIITTSFKIVKNSKPAKL